MKTKFIPGDEWLYYKIYSGPKTADTILIKIIKPLIEDLMSSNIIDKWFFIRYTDPDLHIRLRLHYSQPLNILTIINKLNKEIKTFVKQNLIWKIQIDTYQPELRRYGSNTIEIIESLFCHDSTMVLDMVQMLELDNNAKLRWLFGLMAIDRIFYDVDFSLQAKYNFMESFKNNFMNEFKNHTSIKKQLSVKYRNDKQDIYNVMLPSKNQSKTLESFLYLLRKKSNLSKPLYQKLFEFERENKLEVSLNTLLGSIIHMLSNRIFSSKQRTHELVLYDFLHMFYKSQLARGEV